MALLHTARVADAGDVNVYVETFSYPSAVTGRSWQAERFPGPRIRRVLDDTTKVADLAESRFEASVVVAEDAAGRVSRRATGVPLLGPPLARRMRHDRMRASVQPRVALLVSRINVGEAVVHPAFLDVEGCHRRHRAPRAASLLALVNRTNFDSTLPMWAFSARVKVQPPGSG